MMVKSLVEVELGAFLLDEVSASKRFLSVKNPGCLGHGNEPSLPNIRTTDDILGLSSGCCCTHNRPTWMDRNTSGGQHDSFEVESISSIDLSSLCSVHA